jgi:anti-sigma factor RsiW
MHNVGIESLSEMRCQELVELVSDYLEGALSPADRARFDAHLAACEGCTRYVKQMRLTIRLAGRLTAASMSPEARDALLRAFRDWRSKPPEA